MGVVSVTAVGAFSAVGSILVVALMIAPPATAWLLTRRLGTMLMLSATVAAASAVTGYGVARVLDVSIAGSMATCAGGLFAAAFLFAPDNGLVVQIRRRRSQRLDFAARLLAVHLAHHEGRPEAAEESRIRALHRHLQWSVPFTRQVVRFATSRGVVRPVGELLELTPNGRVVAQDALVMIPPALGTEPRPGAQIR